MLRPVNDSNFEMKLRLLRSVSTPILQEEAYLLYPVELNRLLHASSLAAKLVLRMIRCVRHGASPSVFAEQGATPSAPEDRAVSAHNSQGFQDRLGGACSRPRRLLRRLPRAGCSPMTSPSGSVKDISSALRSTGSGRVTLLRHVSGFHAAFSLNRI